MIRVPAVVVTCWVVVAAAACAAAGSAITTDDVDTAAQEVLASLPSEIAEQITAPDVIADAELACAAMRDVDTASPLEDTFNKIVEPAYHPAVDAGPVGDDWDPARFQALEGPYLLSIGRWFCPEEAVRSNVL